MDSFITVEDVVTIVLAFLVIILGFKEVLINLLTAKFGRVHKDHIIALVLCVVWFICLTVYLLMN